MKGRCLNTGRTWFKKGMVPWNKGKTGFIAWNKGKANLTKVCPICEKVFITLRSQDQKYCSVQCNYRKGAWNKGMTFDYKARPNRKGKGVGAANNNWKGGISQKNKMERVRFRKVLQRQVFERDDYSCQICGQRGVDLQVDHIQPWAEYVEGRFDINNCRTLCVRCHYKITFGKLMPPKVRAWGHHFLKEGI